GVEEAAVEVDELGCALVEGRADHLEHVLDRRRGVALGRCPRAFHAEAARRAAQAEAARAGRVDHEVAAVHGRDAPHRRAARRVPLVEAWLWDGADLDAEAFGAVGVAAPEGEALAVGEQAEGRAGGDRKRTR